MHPIIHDAALYYETRMATFRAEPVVPGGILLLGSSHLEWFDTDRLLPGRRFVNRGIASDRLGIGPRGILHRLDVSVVACRPTCIVFNNGVNDLGELWRHGVPPIDEIEAMYDRVIGAVRAAAPLAPMLIINELPTTGRFAGLNPLIDRFNPHVAEIAAAHRCDHVDAHRSVVGDDGELRDDLTTDGLHLNDAGYAILAEKLDPHLPPVA